ncbi:MAG TPA: rhodoquinone biosynthesis methyltransferase RquA [Gammaproteobacteria bacterium]|nr:rhodoquinone biosynthesis methyltransferase RquA [Gammaproteobacteria bacterium]
MPNKATRIYPPQAKAESGAGGALSGPAGGALAHAEPLPGYDAVGQQEMPEYLARYYWWAYLWYPAVSMFDHQPIINAILFGNYRRITEETLAMMLEDDPGRTLQVASVYGVLVPTLARHFSHTNPLHLIDIAPIQLRRARAKLADAGIVDRVRLFRMNAEALRFDSNSFDSALLFLLLHEMPSEARRHALCEALRVLAPGGRLVLAEYGAFTRSHLFHRRPLRWMFGAAEPFLPSLWHADLPALVRECAAAVDKQATLDREVTLFRGFYRVLRFRIGEV